MISFAPGARGEILLRRHLPNLRGQLRIVGPGASQLDIIPGEAGRFVLFRVDEGANATFSRLTISDGAAGVYSDGV